MAGCGSSPLGDLFSGSCPYDIKATAKLWFVPMTDSAGNRNGFNTSAELTKANIDAKISDPDELARIYPLDYLLKNVSDERGDNIVESFDDGDEAFVSQGARLFGADMVKANYALMKQFASMAAQNMGVYFIDKNNNFIGYTDPLTLEKLYPFQVSIGSLGSKGVQASGTAVSKVHVTFTIPNTVQDGLTKVVPSTVHNLDLINDFKARIPVITTAFTVSGTSAVMTLKNQYGDLVEGLEVGTPANFTLYNETTTSDVVPSLVTEVKGTYTLTISAQTADNVLVPKLTHAPTTSFNFDVANSKEAIAT